MKSRDETSLVKFRAFVLFFVSCVFLSTSGCAVSGHNDNGEPNLAYDGIWKAKFRAYNRQQLGPAQPGYSYTRWNCGDGKPYELRVVVRNGVVSFRNSFKKSEGRISSNSRFRSVYSSSSDFTSIYTGSFEKKEGSLQRRDKGLNGCRFAFDLEKADQAG